MTTTGTTSDWTTYVTPKMEADARRQAAKLVKSGHSASAAAAESAAWLRMRAIRARMIAGVR